MTNLLRRHRDTFVGDRARRRGSPLWLHLCALVAVPLVAVGVLSVATVKSRIAEVHLAGAVMRDVRSVGEIESVRSAVADEVIPTLDAVAVTPSTSPTQSIEAVSALSGARAATDAAMAAIPQWSQADEAVTPARAQIITLRAEADGHSVDPAVLARAYLHVAGDLEHAERDAVVDATAKGLTPESSRANDDLLVLVETDEAASEQLPLLMAAQASSTSRDAREAEGAWLTAWGSYQSLRERARDLSSPELRATRELLLSEPSIAALDDRMSALALSPTKTMDTTEALTLEPINEMRDSGLMAMLARAADLAGQSSAHDQRVAQSRMQTTIRLAETALALVLGATLVVVVVLSRSLRSLATAARRISEGELVDVPERGPREVRTVARALRAAVDGLRRVRDQAQAAARGDLDDPVLQAPLPGPLGQVIHASVERISTAVRAREQLQAELVHQAGHDSLTGLASRSETVALVEAALSRAARTGASTGVLFIDLDRFKGVNDTLGHAGGDAVLQVVAQRLQATARAGDVVGRLGADEFVVVVEGLPGERLLVQLAERLVAAIGEPVELPADLATTSGRSLAQVGASIGIAISRDGSQDVQGLLHEADIAVTRAKSAGGNGVEVFDEALRNELAIHDDLESALREALGSGGLHLQYQPVVHIATGALDGFEALCRWNREGVGPVPPDVFIPVAEGSDLVIDLGRWVLQESTRQLAVWNRERTAWDPSAKPLVMGINISGRHLSDRRVMTDVADALAASGVAPSQLALEITETLLVDDPIATEHLHQLRALGCLVSIDDFGTGYTSIGQLGRMPADVLKIDRSFVASDAPGDREIVVLVVAAAHTLGLVVVAEGAEEVVHLERLRAANCDFVQGYLLSRPLPVAAAAALVTSTVVPGADQGKSIQADVSRQA